VERIISSDDERREMKGLRRREERKTLKERREGVREGRAMPETLEYGCHFRCPSNLEGMKSGIS